MKSNMPANNSFVAFKIIELIDRLCGGIAQKNTSSSPC